jgi:hypothetical protein
MNHNEMPKILALKQLLARFGDLNARKGPGFTAFTIDRARKTYHPAAREAYTRRFIHCKILTAIDHGKPCIDPLREAPNASARRTLWLYMHHALPAHPGKHADIALLRLSNANHLMQGIEQLLLAKLAAGEITDTAYAARVLDDSIFLPFAAAWLARTKGNGAL